ncbi:MAG: carboxypeptidase regulatory-like domain-containing protein [Chitinophagaceae bacterium]|nr:MAG: carboxypeptidase regulatory-like domain-containing protein [Chitinophagaceae bacterium]
MKRTALLLTLQQHNWREKLRQLAARVLPAPPAEHLVSGRVCDETGDPIAFARVEAGGTPYYTEANAAGFFVLHIPEQQFRHPLSLFVCANGYARFEQRLESAPAESLLCRVQREQLARVIPMGKQGQ